MKDVIAATAIAGGTGFFGWFFGKLQTNRERKKTDLQLINEAIAPLLTSISQLTKQNNEMVCQLLTEQDKNLKLIEEKSQWMKERSELIEKIERLEKQVSTLSKKVGELIRKE